MEMQKRLNERPLGRAHGYHAIFFFFDRCMKLITSLKNFR